MTRAQLSALGTARLRQLAARAGLAGAGLLPREALLTGLAAYFACAAPPEEEAEGEEESTSGVAIPPALATPTMARLLESQGRPARAAALRARLDRAPVGLGSRIAVRRGGAGGLEIQFVVDPLAARAAAQIAGVGVGEATRCVRLFLERERGPGETIDVAVADDEGICQAPIPSGVRAVTAALGVRGGGERGPDFVALARAERVTVKRSRR